MPQPAPSEHVILRQRLTADERRARLLDAARTEFARAGFHGASTASIARAAGCSEPMLYKHFAGKRALFMAVLLHVDGPIEEGFDAVLAADGNLLDNLAGYLPAAMQDPAFVESLQLRKLALTLVQLPEVHDALVGQQDRHREHVDRAVTRAKAQGHMRESIVAEDVAWTWTGLMLAGCYREALGAGGFASMLPTVEAFIERLRR